MTLFNERRIFIQKLTVRPGGVFGFSIFLSAMRADSGQFAIGDQRDMATWIGQGVSTMKKDGSASYRGAVYYQSSDGETVIFGPAETVRHIVRVMGESHDCA